MFFYTNIKTSKRRRFTLTFQTSPSSSISAAEESRERAWSTQFGATCLCWWIPTPKNRWSTSFRPFGELARPASTPLTAILLRKCFSSRTTPTSTLYLSFSYFLSFLSAVLIVFFWGKVVTPFFCGNKQGFCWFFYFYFCAAGMLTLVWLGWIDWADSVGLICVAE